MECPVCTKALSTTTFGRITVEVCKGGCGGIWLDRYELMRVDETDESVGEGLLEIERDPNLEVDPSKRLNCPKCPELASAHAQTEEDLARARRIAHAFRFICPSYYIPGKQDWGAF